MSLGLLEAHADQQSPNKSPTKVWTCHRTEAKCAIRHVPSVDILFWTASNLIAWMQLFSSTWPHRDETGALTVLN